MLSLPSLSIRTKAKDTRSAAARVWSVAGRRAGTRTRQPGKAPGTRATSDLRCACASFSGADLRPLRPLRVCRRWPAGVAGGADERGSAGECGRCAQPRLVRASAFGKLPRLAWASVSVAGGAGGAGEHVRQASAAARMSARGPDLRRNCWFLPTAKSSFLRASIQSETSFPREETVPQFFCSFLVN
jgi:hypothetical protein